jgi:peroxiredoxin
MRAIMGLTRSKLGIAAVAVAAVGGCRIAYDLTVRYGRLLLEVEALRQQVADASRQADERAPDATERLPSLPLGMVLSDFDLPDLDGNRVTLSEWQGRTILLIFFDPTCGFSREMLPGLAELSADEPGDRPMPLLISRGDAALNRGLMEAHGVRCRVLLQQDREVARLYSVTGSPMGYLVDEHGRTASSLLVGPDALLAHAGARVGEDQQDQDTRSAGRGSRAPRLFTPWRRGPTVTWDGLPVGTTAPDFQLPRLDGGTLSLSAYRGRPVLLVFWDADATACDGIAAEVEAIHGRASDVQVVMVSRGDPEANCAKVAELGLTVPVGLQSDWSISRAYQMLGAPIAYLIDADGVVATNAVVGQAAIRALLSPGGSLETLYERRGGEVTVSQT